MPGLIQRLQALLRGDAEPRRPPRMVLPPAPTSEEVLAAVDTVERQIEGRVPSVVSARVHRIGSTVRDTVPRMDTLGPGSAQAHTVVATATSYLPEMIGSYLKLPRDWADRRPVEGGKSSLLVLVDQLDLLAAVMDDIRDAVFRADADALVAHGRFLAEKFGSGSLDLGQGTT
jgi:hypothetical protein